MLSSKQIQRQILTQAAARPTGFVLPLPSSLVADPSQVALLLEEMIEREYVVERPLLPHETFWIEEGADRATVLVITGLGSRAVLAETSASLLQRSADGRIDPNTLTVDERHNSHLDKPSLDRRKTQGKLQQLIQALDREDGATVAELAKITSWQEKSVRAALSAQLQGRMGLQIETTRSIGSALRYRILRASRNDILDDV